MSSGCSEPGRYRDASGVGCRRNQYCIYSNVFEWDGEKALRNVEKHGVTFEEAATTFADPAALDWADVGHSINENRSKRLGRSAAGRVVLVVYTLRRSRDGTEAIRIIGARHASRKERAAYAGRAH